MMPKGMQETRRVSVAFAAVSVCVGLLAVTPHREAIFLIR